MKQEPVYTNEFKKPVYNVNNAGIHKVKGSVTLYELQLNDQYFQISAEMLETLEAVTRMPDSVGLLIG